MGHVFFELYFSYGMLFLAFFFILEYSFPSEEKHRSPILLVFLSFTNSNLHGIQFSFFCKERREIARYYLFSGSVCNSFGASWAWVFELWSLWLNSFADLVFHRLFPLQHNCDSFSLQLAREQSSLIAGQRDSASGRYRTTKQVPNRLPWLQILPVAQETVKVTL